MIRQPIASLVLIALILLASSPAPAALVAQMDFQSVDTAPNPDQTPITNNPIGSSNTGQLVVDPAGDVNVNTGATGLGPEFGTSVRYGFLDIPAPDSGGAVSFNTAGSNGNLSNYLTGASANMGSGTVLVVVKPDFSGPNNAIRRTWFSHNVQSASQIWLFNSDDARGPRIFVGQEGNISHVALESFNYDATKFYLIGGTWQDTSIGVNVVNRTLSIYARELNSSMPAALVDSATFLSTSGFGLAGAPFYVGRRSNFNAEAADGDIALFQMYDNYFSTADFDYVYATLFAVPEPSTFSLLSLGLLGAAIHRRRRQRSSRKNNVDKV